MLYGSVFYSLFLKAYIYLKMAFIKSGTYRIGVAIWSFLTNIFENSFFYKVMFSNGKGIIVENSSVYKIVNGVKEFSEKQADRLNVVFNTSYFINMFKDKLNTVFYVPINYFGVLFLTLGVSFIGLSLAFGVRVFPVFLGYGLVVLSIILLLMKTSLNNLFAGSFISRLILQYFHVTLKSENVQASCYKFYGLFGIITGFLLYFLSLKMFVMVFFGVCAFLFIMWKTEIGIVATIFTAAFLPTRFSLATGILTILSFTIKAFVQKKYTVKYNTFDFFVFIYCILVIASTAFSYNISGSIAPALTQVIYIGLYFAIRNIITSKEQLLSVISIFVFSCVLVALYGILQKHTGLFITNESWVDDKMFEDLIGRVFATMDNPNMLGELFVYAIPLSFAMVYYMKNPFIKLVSLGMTGILGLCLIYTLSRGAWIGAIMALAIFAVMHDRRLVGLGAFVLFLSPLLLPESILNRFTSIGNTNDTSTSYRLSIWRASYKMSLSYWLIGIGLGFEVFMEIYPKFAYAASYALHAHNLFLQLVIDLGVFGLILFFILIFLFYKSLFSSFKTTEDRTLKAVISACAGCIIGFLAHSMADYTWFNYRLIFVFWLIMAFAQIIVSISDSTNEVKL